MSKASLFINDVEYPILNPRSFVVSKSKSLVHNMCAPLFGNLHLFLKVHSIRIFLNSLTSKENTINGKISVYGISKPERVLYNIEFMKASMEIYNIDYDQEKESIHIEIYLKPTIQKVGKVVIEQGCKSNIKFNY